MRRSIMTLAALSVGAAFFLAAASTASAWHNPKRWRTYDKPYPPPPPETPWVSPPAPGPSAHCRKHPAKCDYDNAGAVKVDSPFLYCVDKEGNGDGIAQKAEVDKFGGFCNR